MRHLFVLAILAGCTIGDEADDDVRIDDIQTWDDLGPQPHVACQDALPTIDADAPIFVNYGPYRAASGKPSRVDSPQTLSLTAPGERVITLRRPSVNCVRSVAELGPWIAGGGLVAHTMTIEDLNTVLADGTSAQHVAKLLRSGYAYVAIDEIAFGNTGWRNGGVQVARFAKLATDLAAMGLDRRLIIYINSYNLAGILGQYSAVLATARDHARIIGSEIYVHTSDVEHARASPSGHCNRATSCFEQIAAEMGAAAPNINYRTVTVLGVSDEYNQGAPDALCNGGALQDQYAALHAGAHTRLQPGVGAYTLARIERDQHPSWGAAEHAACKRRLDAWAAWPRARP